MEHRINASGLLALGVAASAASLAFLPIPFADFFLTWAVRPGHARRAAPTRTPSSAQSWKTDRHRTRQDEEAMLVDQSPART
jgi:hypothetical protein